MKLRNFWMLGALCGGLLSCSDEMVFQEEEEKVLSEAPFTIYASNGVDTRLQYGEDGLTLQWNDQDQLLLIDVTGKLKPIPLTTTLEAPSAKAVFRSESAVPAGTYFVRNVGRMNKLTSSLSNSELMTFGNNPNEDEYCLYKGFLQERSKLQQDIDLYLESPITVKEGQVSVDVELKHAYAMIKVKILNADDKWPTDSRTQIGMICPTRAFPMQTRIGTDGITKLLESPKLSFTGLFERLRGKTLETVSEYAALILPVDLTGQKVYFYVSDTKGDNIIKRDEKVYEIVKEGINLEAGVCYTIVLDLNDASVIEIRNGELSESRHFRALAYASEGGTYNIMSDIDFANDIYFPITIIPASQVCIEGNGHKLSNLNINWPFKGAGLFSGGKSKGNVIRNLNMESVTIVGGEQVGAFWGARGCESLENCHLLGENTIKGTGNMVGGLISGDEKRHVWQTFKSCSVSNETIVTGEDFVGGLFGRVEDGQISDCSSAAKVNGVNNVGGIVGAVSYGYNGGDKDDIFNCSSSAEIVAEGDKVGGIVGWNYSMHISIGQSSFLGKVTGRNYVGGIFGATPTESSITSSFSYGTIKGQIYVGGISGTGGNTKNCYSLSAVTGTDETYTGGIVGEIGNVENCYFAGEVSNGCGIAGNAKTKNGKYIFITNSITTAEKLSSSDSDADKAYTNLKSIQNNVGFINADQVYATESENMWPDVANHCPKFLWQITDGENSETTSPPFTDGGEW